MPTLPIRETTTFNRTLCGFTRTDREREAIREAIRDALAADPEAGAVIPQTGGARKLRVAVPGRGKGKSGGARILYALVWGRSVAYLLLAYDKADAENLTSEEKAALRTFLRDLEDEGPP